MRATLALLTAGLLISCTDSNSSDQTNVSAQSCADLTIRDEWIFKIHGDSRLHRIRGELPPATSVIEWIEPNYRGRPLPPIESSKTFFRRDIDPAELLHVANYLEEIKVSFAWQNGYWGEGRIIAVIDSGIDIFHPRLKENIHVNTGEIVSSSFDNGIDDDGNGFIDDYFGWNFTTLNNQIVDETGHGTHIAGIIAASHSSLDAPGIAPAAQLLAVDFVAGAMGDEFAALESIGYAIDRGADIINNSWSSVCSGFLREAFQKWENKNIVFVSSSGNDGADITNKALYPANLDLANHVTVGAFDRDFKVADFSNFGTTVTVLAPGEMILSLARTKDPEELIFRSGTSMSAAFVSASFAIGWSLRPDLSAQQMVKIFREIHRPEGVARNLDIRAFVKAVQSQATPD